MPLDPLTLTKFLDPLPLPGAMPQDSPNHYEIGMWQTVQQLHAQLPPTTVWGYGTSQATASYPALSIVAQRGVPIQVHWTNNLPMTHLLESANDTTIMGARPPHGGVPVVPHVHGGETEPESDGHPYQWFTQGFTDKGPSWAHETFTYHNAQQASTIWYHDHGWGFTRLNVYAGLAGYYLVTDPAREPIGLPSGAFDVPICIQDKMFNDDGSLLYPNMSVNPEHPIWGPEFFGDVLMVNGKVWPYLDVEARRYRFRFLNGSQARFYSLRLENENTGAPGPAFHQIGTDGGYLPCVVVLNNPQIANPKRLIIAPGERCDVIIDFSGLAPGTRFILANDANAPYPDGDPVDPATTAQVMEFRVTAPTSFDNTVITTQNTLPDLVPTRRRTVTMIEKQGPGGPLAMYLDGREFTDADGIGMPRLGGTELWEFVNLTMDAHPMHLHLVQFLPFSRQPFDAAGYLAEFDVQNPEIPLPLGAEYHEIPIAPYLAGVPYMPDGNERGWKDTFRCNPGEVTRILVRFSPQDGGAFPFDATTAPYVFHCHILEHEENDMMRPYHLTNAGPVGGPNVLTPADYPVPGAPDEIVCSDPTAVQLALVSGATVNGSVHLVWFSPEGAGNAATLYRSTDGSAWTAVTRLAVDGGGYVTYDDADVLPGERYGYRLGVLDGATERFMGEAWIDVPASLEFTLGPPTPNPARGGASFHFALPRPAMVRLDVYDAGGRRVREIASGFTPAGGHTVRWDATDAAGNAVANGLYFVRLSTLGRTLTQRVVLMKE